MKKFILSVSAVALMAIVSCSKDSTCNCSDGGDTTVKSMIELAKNAGALGSEAACNTMNTQVKALKSTASCSWS